MKDENLLFQTIQKSLKKIELVELQMQFKLTYEFFFPQINIIFLFVLQRFMVIMSSYKVTKKERKKRKEASKTETVRRVGLVFDGFDPLCFL